MRVLAEAAVIISVSLTLARFAIAHLMRRRRRLSNAEHVERLEAENRRIDESLDRIRRKETTP